MSNFFTKFTKVNRVLPILAFTSVLALPAQAGWEVEWIDKFNGNGVNWQNWTAQVQANYNNEIQCYTDDESSEQANLVVSDGTLKIHAYKKEVACAGLGGQQRSWTSARLNSKDKREFLYGRIEARLRFSTLDGGVWPAFWSLENRIAEHPVKGDNDTVHWPNPGAGEIDIWEWFSNQGDSYITNFFNSSGCGGEFRPKYAGGAADVLDFHVYGMEWDEEQVQFFMNDQIVHSVNIADCPQYKEPMFLLINLAIGGNLGGSVDPALNKATFEIDYIAHCSATSANEAQFCNESTPIAQDDDADGVSNNLDECPATEPNTEVNSKGCKVLAFKSQPEQGAPSPKHLPSQVIAIFSDVYDTIGGVDVDPDWGQSTQVSIEQIGTDNVLKYLGLNYQGLSFENNSQDVSDMTHLHLDYWSNNSMFVQIYAISPGPNETSFELPLTHNQWQSIDIPLSEFHGVDLTELFQFKVEGNGTVYLDNLYFHDGILSDETEEESTAEPNVEPSIELVVSQNETILTPHEDQSYIEVSTGDGEVSLRAVITDINRDDTHSQTWQVSNALAGEVSGSQFHFDPSQVTAGDYELRVTVSDNGLPPLATTATITLRIVNPSKASGLSPLLLISTFGLIALRRRLNFSIN